MIQVKIFVETGNHKELEEEINKFLTEMSTQIDKVIDIKFIDSPGTRYSNASFDAMVIYEI